MVNDVEVRVRAWVLIQASDPQTVKDQIKALDQGKDELVVIRVDGVDSGPSNIVAAIDAAQYYYDQTVAYIRGIAGITNVWFLRVVEHDPPTPNNASGYVTEDERLNSESKMAYAGRQEGSPGYNPWG